jgi:hypothetical protein
MEQQRLPLSWQESSPTKSSQKTAKTKSGSGDDSPARTGSRRSHHSSRTRRLRIDAATPSLFPELDRDATVNDATTDSNENPTGKQAVQQRLPFDAPPPPPPPSQPLPEPAEEAVSSLAESADLDLEAGGEVMQKPEVTDAAPSAESVVDDQSEAEVVSTEPVSEAPSIAAEVADSKMANEPSADEGSGAEPVETFASSSREPEAEERASVAGTPPPPKFRLSGKFNPSESSDSLEVPPAPAVSPKLRLSMPEAEPVLEEVAPEPEESEVVAEGTPKPAALKLSAAPVEHPESDSAQEEPASEPEESEVVAEETPKPAALKLSAAPVEHPESDPAQEEPAPEPEESEVVAEGKAGGPEAKCRASG